MYKEKLQYLAELWPERENFIDKIFIDKQISILKAWDSINSFKNMIYQYIQFYRQYFIHSKTL